MGEVGSKKTIEVAAVRPWSPPRAPADLVLAALLALQCFIIVVAAPAAATGYRGGRTLLELSILSFGVLVFLLARTPITKLISVIAIVCGFSGSLLELWSRADISELPGEFGSLVALLLVIYLVGRAVLGPGEITVYRVLGAVALYLSLGMLFAAAYRLCWELAPAALAGIPAGIDSWQVQSSMLYVSFATMTSLGSGQIVPMEPFIRALCNLQAIIGQLYPATLLARLVTLQLENRKR